VLYDIVALKKQLKPGDVFVVHGRHLISRMIRIVTDSHWNHATMYVGKGRFIEANNKAVETRPLEEYEGKEIEIYRHKKATAYHQKKIVEAAMQKRGKGYDFFHLVQFFWLFVTGRRGNARQLGSKNKYICSELVASSYAEAGLKVYKNYNPTQISPADFPESDQFRLCVQQRKILLLK
jgi:uncharacterized protein YycO